MSNLSDISKSLLPHQQKTLVDIKFLFPYYYLSGGTALSFHIGHRISYDFDLFTDGKISSRMVKAITDKLSPSSWLVQSPDELTFFDSRNVKITLLHYPYKQIRTSVWKYDAFVDSIEDIVANKLFTIGQRAQIRDYIDIFTILDRGIFDIRKCADLATEKYGKSFDASLAVGQLCYFDDLDFGDSTFVNLGKSKDQFFSMLTSQAKKLISV